MIKNIKQGGYTLIELLTVMLVLVTVGIIVGAILVSSLRGGSKINTIDTVRQSGNYTILQLSKAIEFAQSFGGVSMDNLSYISDCPSPTTQYKYIKIKSFDNAQTIYSCNMSTNPPTIASNGASFINTSEVTLTSCYFTCGRSNVSQSPTIGINFTLSQNSSSNFFEKKATIPFETSVVIRNLNK